ncbi:unnamed protein product, partial [Schistosoma curassoni]|uniref:Uncharacterized protein n=1 Tax=Schistosoma curassoni TaxID=6186 RepID=A0A183KTF6_9TREM
MDKAEQIKAQLNCNSTMMIGENESSSFQIGEEVLDENPQEEVGDFERLTERTIGVRSVAKTHLDVYGDPGFFLSIAYKKKLAHRFREVMFELSDNFSEMSRSMMIEQMKQQHCFLQYDKEMISNFLNLMNIHYTWNCYHNNNCNNDFDINNIQEKLTIEHLNPFMSINSYTDYPFWSSMLISAATAAGTTTTTSGIIPLSATVIPSTIISPVKSLSSLSMMTIDGLQNDISKINYEEDFFSKLLKCTL